MGVFFEGRPSRGWVWVTGMFAGAALVVLAWLAVRPFSVWSVGFAIFGLVALVLPLPVFLMGVVEVVDPQLPQNTPYWTPSKWRANAMQNVWIGGVMYAVMVLVAALFAAVAG